jgi:hypothetical protein
MRPVVIVRRAAWFSGYYYSGADDLPAVLSTSFG